MFKYVKGNMTHHHMTDIAAWETRSIALEYLVPGLYSVVKRQLIRVMLVGNVQEVEKCSHHH